MKIRLFLLPICLLLAVAPAYAHHPAADIVDDEIYDMIDSMVADTPHASLDFDEMGGDVVMTITTRDVADIETMIEGGLLTFAGSLSGQVSVAIDFDGGGGRTTLTITQAK